MTLLLALTGLAAFRVPVVGGSGLVWTVLAASAAMYPGRRLNLILFTCTLRSFFLVLLGLDFLCFLADLFGTGNGVAQQVHLAGALVGWLAVGGFGRGELPGFLLRWRQKRARKLADRAREADAAVEAELDRILAKIGREGMTSLTAREREFLHKRSRGKE